jgi:LDH2 family malate/lactate/ureidoglycolate dehydrogenase
MRHPDPVMFDMACSEVARGKLETAEREGKQVPLGWGIDGNGEPSTDPTEILKNGSLLPFGGIKGYCITILVEALSSMLTFSTFGKGIHMGERMNTGHFVLLLDPERFGDPVLYRNSIDEYVDSIKNAPLAPGAEEIIVPGELEARSIRNRTENGMQLDEAVASSLAEVAIKIGLLSEGQGFDDMLTW